MGGRCLWAAIELGGRGFWAAIGRCFQVGGSTELLLDEVTPWWAGLWRDLTLAKLVLGEVSSPEAGFGLREPLEAIAPLRALSCFLSPSLLPLSAPTSSPGGLDAPAGRCGGLPPSPATLLSLEAP